MIELCHVPYASGMKTSQGITGKGIHVHSPSFMSLQQVTSIMNGSTHTMSAMCKSNLHPTAVLQPATAKCVLKLQRQPYCNCSSACIPVFAACIIDSGQGWTGAFVSFGMLSI